MHARRRDRILRLHTKGLSAAEIAARVMTTWQIVCRVIADHGPVPPSVVDETACDAPTAPAPVSVIEPARASVSMPKARKTVEIAATPAQQSAPSFPALGGGHRGARMPSRTSAPIDDEERDLIDAAIAAGRVTHLPAGPAAGISRFENQFFAAPPGTPDQMKGSWSRRRGSRRGSRSVKNRS